MSGRGRGKISRPNTILQIRTSRASEAPSTVRSPPSPRRQRVVQLHQHNPRNAHPGVDEAQQCPHGIERLRDYGPSADAAAHLFRRLRLDPVFARRERPSPIEHSAQHQDVPPVNPLRRAIGNELRQQPRRQWPASTALSEDDTSLEVQQKLMRHADIRTTMQYGGVPMENKRAANSRAVREILPLKASR